MLSPTQLHRIKLLEFSLIYSADTEKNSRLKFLDQCFNTIGSGNDFESFLFEITETTDPQLSFLDIYEALNSEDGKKLRSLRPKPDFVPYPNFNPEYSFICDVNDEELSLLGKEWIDEICWFYQECINFFFSKDVHHYHQYFPEESNEKEWKQLVSMYENAFDRLFQKEKEKNPSATKKEVIEEAYNIPYNGDIKDFIKARGERDVQRAVSFCRDAIISPAN